MGGRLSTADGWAILQSSWGWHAPGLDWMPGVFSTALRYVHEKRKLGEFVANTARERWYTLARFADTVGPDRQPSRITRRHIEKWLMSRDVAPETKRKEFSTVRAFCTWCVEHELMRKNPCTGMKAPRAPKRQPRGFSHEQVAGSIAVADLRARVAMLLFVQEGLRLTAVTRLTTDRIDLDQRSLLALEKGGKEVWKPLSDETATAIKAYLEEHPASYGAPLLRSYKEPSLGISSRHLLRVVTEALYEAGVKRRPYDGRSPHAFRHTMANDMLDNGADIKDVQAMLDHARLSSTEVYLRRQRALGQLREAASGRSYLRDTET